MRLPILAAAVLSLSFVASPLAAKDEPAPAPAIATLVDPSLEADPDNILLLDLSNGGRVAIRLMPQWAPGHV